MIRAFLVLACLVMLPITSWADKWAMPVEPMRVTSQNNTYRFTAIPNGVAFPQDVPKGLAALRLPDGPCFAYMETTQPDGTFSLLWYGHLSNPVSPLDVLVSNDGQTVTLDDWGQAGHGPNAIVLYGANGETLHQSALADVMTADLIARLKHSISSIWWRTSALIEETNGTLAIKVDIPAQTQLTLKNGLWVRAPAPWPFIVIALHDGTLLRAPNDRRTNKGMVR